MTRDGVARPVVIKMARDLGEDIIQSNKRTMGLTSKQFEKYLDQVRNKKKKKKKSKHEGSPPSTPTGNPN